jgi:hypothetical protein
MDRNHESLPADLTGIAEVLHAERARPTGLELDRMKTRAMAQAQRARARRKDSLMRSRLAILTMLVFGILLSGTGATMAVTGLSGDGSAGQAQYGEQGVAPREESSNGEQDTLGGAGGSGGSGGQSRGAGPEQAQATRQVESDDGNGLAFTGYAAIPVLLAGLGLLMLGLVMRRRAQEDTFSTRAR